MDSGHHPNSLANLRPFTGGPDPRRRVGTGRPSIINDPDKLDLLAQALADGQTMKDIAEVFDVSVRTVRTWKNNPKVKNAALKYVEDRILRVTRRTDSQLEALVRSPKFQDLEVDDQVTLLIKLRREMLGGVLRLQAESGKASAEDISAAMAQMDDDPTFAAGLKELLETTKVA